MPLTHSIYILHLSILLIHSPLSIIHYQLSIINYPLSIINYPFSLHYLYTMQRTTRYISLLLFAILSLILTASCSHKPATTQAKLAFADSIAVDSLTLWAEDENAQWVSVQGYVMDTIAPVYRLTGDQLYLDTTLMIGDSLRVKKDAFTQYFDGRFHPVSYHGREGYIRGTSLGYGIESDLDDDGRRGLVLYGYSRYVRDTSQDVSFNPLVIRFISPTGAISQLHDTTYSDILMKEARKVRLKHIHVYELTSGYPECGYPQIHFILAYGSGKAGIIRRDVSGMDSRSGDFCEFYDPTDSTRRPDTVYITRRQATPLLGTDTASAFAGRDSAILYIHEGKWGRTINKKN